MDTRPILTALALLAAALFRGSAAGREKTDPVRSETLDEYARLISMVQEWSVGQVDADQLVDSSIRGMISRLDPHTTFFEPGDFASLEERQRGTYVGVGISVQRGAGRVMIMEVTQGAPAWKAGLRAGDVITEIDGRPIEEPQDTEDVSLRVRGPKGTTVRLTVRRAGVREPIRVALTRGEISSSSVLHSFMLGESIGYVQLAEFTNTSADDMRMAVTKLKQEGMKNLLLDLRENPGGSLESALEISDMFLQKGQKIVSTSGRIPSSNQDYLAKGQVEHFDGPLVILINRGSASASEIVSGAIQDHDRGWIVGTTSWGKGLVQDLFPLSYGAGLALTTARYLTPSGRWIQRDYSDRAAYLFPDSDHEPVKEAPEGVKTFLTDAGRPVRSEGGITPDEVVTPGAVSDFERRLLAKEAIFGFAVDYVAAHPTVGKDFSVDDSVREEFFRSIERGKIETAAAARDDYKRDANRTHIDSDVASEVLTLQFGPDEGWRRALRDDPQAERALRAFQRARF
jgi:carboxyl-terminal processing protease